MENDPKTRRESKKDKKTKSGEKYGKKHVRIMENLAKKN